MRQSAEWATNCMLAIFPYDTNEDDLTALFAKAGNVSTVNVMRDRETGRARGFAFVEMATDQDAQNAISQLHEQSFGGRTLTVNEARPQQPRGGGGGGFGVGGRRRPRRSWWWWRRWPTPGASLVTL